MDPESDKTTSFAFQEAIGSLNFAQTCIQPDISYTLNVVGQFAKNLELTHCTTVKKLFRYLKGTNHLELSYSKIVNPHQPFAYCDADFVANLTDRKS